MGHETAWYLVGLEKLLMDMMMETPYVDALFDKVMEVNTEIGKQLIEIGLDILNPLQPLATGMDAEFLKTTYGKDLVFFGGFDIQELLPNGTTEEIRKEVSRLTKIYGKGGGFMIAPAHNIQDDTSVENILAFFEAVKEQITSN